jgi:hypothetical protein
MKTKRFDAQSEPTPQMATPSYAERQFLHTFMAGAILPLVQAFITGVIVFIVALTFALRAGVMDPFSWPITLGVVVFGGMWLGLQRRWLTLTNLERILNVDINQDGEIGEPKSKEPVVIRIDRITNGHYQSSTVRLPASEEQLMELAHGFETHRPFTEREWTGDGKAFSSDEFRALRREMLRRELIMRKSARGTKPGYVLTADGVEVMKNYKETIR